MSGAADLRRRNPMEQLRSGSGRPDAAGAMESAVPLEPKAFDILLYFIENRDRVVPKQELLKAF